ncbi:hypothetical protein COU57_05865 [Candidatus Pacearchaeota archaeon CG10_big_fil_rev_8_21_14_0_10_32_14]|nr:MAG: hypothetical protein COU57_05865 [Candidatus Pacearchaeota archaeon CG10_big_fil_rev_8_21_14_0_10_32_14]
MEKNIKYIFIIFAIILFLYALFSIKISYHDSNEYITVAKYFAGINNVDLFSAHSVLYPILISLALKMWASDIMLRLCNVFWIFLISISLYLFKKDKKLLLLFIFSPIVWIVGIQTTPVLPATLFFTLSYLFFEKKSIKYHLYYSGLFAGLSIAFYDPMIILIVFYLLIYFWRNTFNDFLMFFIMMTIGIFPRLIIDYKLFGNPFYSFIRYFGANVLVSMGVRESRNFGVLLDKPQLLLPLIIIISPLLIFIYKIDIKKYKNELLLIILVSSFFLIRIFNIKYFLILTPIILMSLKEVLTDREIKWHCILSIFIILIFVSNTFSYKIDRDSQNDLEEIEKNYPSNLYLTYTDQAYNIAVYSWENNPRFIWLQDYEAYNDNRSTMKSYSVETKSKIPLREKMVIRFDFDRPDNQSYGEIKYLIINKNILYKIDKTPSLRNYQLIKCYNELCVYGIKEEQISRL